MVGTSEFSICTRRIFTTFFIWPITTIIFMITLPSGENATAILTAELTGTTCVISCFEKSCIKCHKSTLFYETENFVLHILYKRYINLPLYKQNMLLILTAVIFIFIRVITTVIWSITCPQSGYTFSICTIEFVNITTVILWDTHLVFVDKLQSCIALALNLRKK